MENLQHQSVQTERRVMSRIDAALRINYQIISDDVALNDPYDPNFVLPRYFLLLAELDQFDHALNYELEQLAEKDQQIARILSLFNQKLNLITGSLYDAIVQSMLPVPEHVNFSETGLSFFSERAIKEGTYIHVTLSHPENFFHIAATAQVVYSREEESNLYRTGAYFITLLPQDRVKLAECIALTQNKE
ncbi:MULTISPECIES: PilZ domain-containing protein [Acinetobacter]|uniref:PilZ domain-containing protein n=1 Tax=Acinetobacter TaxID=469 RepID=UPI0009931AA7|nr:MULTISPECIES: PilZ domain-containing protein [Acinetobacter]MCL6230550.1 PilZ domain-containing protein [Acinetobacter amyesii]MCL6237336.1 PilZ domain-containing protein [Acinetobacter amyesii]MCL6240508.1 PilZ domain-containing protein [Acinetobacter amyesii]MCL6245067.1 PilZ domain-containing protein [Acinetobacter amyesii]OOV83966.1 PilZ domain-containing protein [Acinetobacter sp. ANC 5600]